MTADVAIVLVRPARGANLGAACRALKNMGLADLRLVGETPDRLSPEVRNIAYGAWDVLDGARCFDTLPAAVADRRAVFATSAREVPGSLSPRQLAERARAPDLRPLAVVFGPEAHGLTGDELALCPGRVRIPSDPAQPSLNLAQAVLLIAYELRLADIPEGPAPEIPPAAVGELEAALDHLAEGLLAIGYLDPRSPGTILAEWRRLLHRAHPTSREVSLIRGLARQVGWAARSVARVRAAGDNAPPREDDR